MTKPHATAIAVVKNLFVATHIAAVARSVGVALEIVSPEQAERRCRELGPALVVVDLEAGPDIFAIIARVKSDLVPAGGRLVGFYPHVRNDLREAAVVAGLDQAIPRSALQKLLPGLLRASSATMP